MHELAPGLWHWQAPHPQWEPGEPWDRNVSSYALADGDQFVLVDPIAPPPHIEARAAAILLTCPWHERDARRLVERLAIPLHAPLPDTAQDLMRKFGITAQQAGDGSPDLNWLRDDPDVDFHPYAAGDRLPASVEALPGHYPNDLVLWAPRHGAVIAGDTLVDFGRGLQINDRLPGGATRQRVASALRPLLDRPVRHVLATHGGPTDRSALAGALG